MYFNLMFTEAIIMFSVYQFLFTSDIISQV